MSSIAVKKPAGINKEFVTETKHKKSNIHKVESGKRILDKLDMHKPMRPDGMFP